MGAPHLKWTGEIVIEITETEIGTTGIITEEEEEGGVGTEGEDQGVTDKSVNSLSNMDGARLEMTADFCIQV